ncbi:MAG: bifunctional 2-polyprenyl-6-hydroxyphenol methylase/3-demethylubiquinol 3-O-methyltransferase UbiG, partial [Coxiellaceae bacterium]|nr:bifunctional 2-polyprenyl-6-hydroxyphenol methylase/3-demethylubiquinol 3-O-methyltransferase UbiG [Coxiellaceae bacterium]
ESAEVTGIDLSEAAIDVAKNHSEKKRVLVDYQCIAVEEIALNNKEKFDVVTCMEMLEHVPDPAAILQACADCLKPGGKLFVSTINRNLKSYLGAVIAAEYVLRLLPRGTHHYEKFIKPSELNAWATHANLKLGGLQGIHYQPFSGNFQLTDDVSINYLAYYEK